MYKILLADDSERNSNILKDVIESWEGYQVLSAKDGSAALELAAAQEPDVVLLDVMMPGMSGYEVCHALRQNTITAGIPIVLISALSEVEDRIHGYNEGADVFLCKPVNHEELKAVLQRAVARQNRENKEEGLRSLISFMVTLSNSSGAVTPMPSALLQQEKKYCGKLALKMGLEERTTEQLQVALELQDWQTFLEHVSPQGEALADFRKFNMSKWLLPLLQYGVPGNLQSRNEVATNIFAVVRRYGYWFLKCDNTKEALQALKKEAMKAKCNLQMICRLETIIQAEDILQNL
jgi:putative two-component system response regulator